MSGDHGGWGSWSIARITAMTAIVGGSGEWKMRGLLVAAAIPLALALSQVSTGAGALESHRDARYESVVGQTTWYTCGAAAVATLLTHTFEIVTTEADVMEWFEAQGVLALEEERGLTALNLRDALEAWGVPVRAFRVTLASLADFFERGGLPVIAHVTVPQRHFVVLNGLVDDQVLMADPSWGSSMAPLASLDDLKGFSGVVLVPVPTGELLATGRARQLDALAAAGQRLERLERLREVVP